jgi:hypothetical protein
MAKINVTDWNDSLSSYLLYPAGRYLVTISDSKEEGDKVIIDFLIAEGDNRGGTIKKYLSMASEKAAQMSAKTWVSICKAVGKESQETMDLHGSKLYIDLVIEDDKIDQNKKYNSIKNFLSVSSGSKLPDFNNSILQENKVIQSASTQKDTANLNAVPW